MNTHNPTEAEQVNPVMEMFTRVQAQRDELIAVIRDIRMGAQIMQQIGRNAYAKEVERVCSIALQSVQ